MTGDQQEARTRQGLSLVTVDLVGGNRTVSFRRGLNIVRGDITTGKTTLIRLVHALLGSVPSNLPPEAAALRGVRGRVHVGPRLWEIYRPLISSNDAPVQVASVTSGEDDEPLAFRLPAAGRGGYGEFLLSQLQFPVMSVPRTRREPTSESMPVTINDWLLYCIITGDDLDTQVFGHKHPFRDLKRRWVFEIAYGLYDEELAILVSSLRKTDLEIRAAESEVEVVKDFLRDASIGDPEELQAQLVAQRSRLSEMRRAPRITSGNDGVEPDDEISDVRAELLDARLNLDSMRAEIRQLVVQLGDLKELRRHLVGLSKRLTRSIVADEWMVDFDFVVCPRCGHDVDRHRAEAPICYLCEQPEPTSAPDRDALIREQDRVTYQIAETDQLIGERTKTLDQLRSHEGDLTGVLSSLSSRLDDLTEAFVSAKAADLQRTAAEAATIEANVQWIERLLSLTDRQRDKAGHLEVLLGRKAELEERIESREASGASADENISALERRTLDYLTRLHVPQLGDLLSVRLNRTTYLPEVSARTFDELSSQGLKTLVNVAHALAHHTVAIDRDLDMPGLLILDGVSANSGKEGLEGDRVVDMYELFNEVTAEYGDRLQLIIVDNDLPPEVASGMAENIVLTLSQDARLVGPLSPAPGEASEN